MENKSCPLGHSCHSMKDGKMITCAWLQTIEGLNPQTGSPVQKEDCAISLLPLLLIQNAKESSITSNAVNSFRDSVIEKNNQAIAYHQLQQRIINA
jgi:hypothetical protein